MITSWQLYLVTRLSSVGHFFGVVAIVSAVLCAVSLGICVIANGEDEMENKKWFRVPVFSGIAALLLGFCSALIPTTKQMAAILIIPKMTQAIAGNAEIQKLPDNLLGLANEWIEELKPKKDK